MLSKNSISQSIREIFRGMEEGREYELLPEAMEAFNRERKNHGYNVLLPFSFRKVGKDLLIDWKLNKWQSSKIGNVEDRDAFSFSLALSFSFALSLSFAFAFAENQFRPIQLPDHDGETREIDGQLYRLMRV